jgi:hypothetical protein
LTRSIAASGLVLATQEPCNVTGQTTVPRNFLTSGLAG